MSNMTMTMEFDPPTALRLARYEVETGLTLADLLVSAVEQWEKVCTEQGEDLAKAPRRVAVQFDYTPRLKPRRRFQTNGLYDPQRHEVEITDTPPELVSLRGHRGKPSEAAIRVVEALNPGIVPNRNGNDAWKESRTGRTVGELHREFRNSPPGR
jgi:hypothetical protein